MSAVPTSCLAPFVGLRAFNLREAHWFCGRERETAALTRKVRASSFSAVVGPSGSGKSSLVRAGVLSTLTADGWLNVIARPGSAPIATLAATLARAAGQPEDRLAEACRFRFDATLRASAYGLAEIAETLAPEAPRIVLVVDQFEELFRYGQDARAAAAAGMREEGRAYVELLLAATAGAGRLHIVLTMRSDYFGNCSAYQGLAEAVSAGQYLVPLPHRDQLETAIREPVAKANAMIEDGLVQRLLVDVEEEADQLPLLQHTLLRLWDAAQGEPRRLREVEYVEVGRLAGSIDKKAEAIFTQLAETHSTDAATLERVMKALTDLDEHDRATRRPLKRSELVALLAEAPDGADAAETSLNRVLEALGAEDASFLQITSDEDPDVDVGHEALIRSWRRLAGQRLDFKSGWLCEEREDGERWRENVRRAAEGRRLSIPGQWYLSRWLRRRRFGSAWARRYGDAWDNVQVLRRRSLAASASLVAAGSAIILIAVGTYIRQFENPRQEILGLFADLHEMSPGDWNKHVEQTFDRAAEDLLSDAKAHRWLREKLTQERDQLPDWYGLNEPPSLSRLELPAIFVLEYSPDRNLKERYFNRRWPAMAQRLADIWGIPAPMAFRLDPDQSLNLHEVRISAPTGESVILKIPTYEEHVVVNAQSLSGDAQQFMRSFSDEWWPTPIKLPLMGKGEPPWLVVPRWSLPVWKREGAATLHGSEVTAVLVAKQLLDNPEVLLTPKTVQLLLDRIAKDYPDTVAEAQRARGEELPRDFAEFVKLRQSLATLPVLLDELAQFPKQGSAKGPSVEEFRPDSGRSKLPTTAQQPRPVEEATPASVVAQAIDAMGAQDATLPKQLHGPWTKDDEVSNDPLPEIAEMDAAFRQVEPWLTSSRPLIGIRSPTAEYVSWLLSNLSPELRRWLKAHYSLTDLKLLLRGILVSAAAPEAAPNHAFWHTEWLLGSLVFWAQTTNLLDPRAMVDRLLKAEMARLEDESPALSADESEAVGIGVRALSQGRVKDAEKLFAQAGRDEATAEAFLALYSAEAPEMDQRPLEDPEEAAYLAQETIKEYDPFSTDPRSLAGAQQLLEGALQLMDEQQALDFFLKVLATCQARDVNKWCWDLLDSLARAAPKGDIPLEAAYQLSSFEPRRYLEHALEHAERAEASLSLSTLSDEDRARKTDILTYSRAVAYDNLAALGDAQRWRDPEKLLKTVLGSPAVGSMAHAALISLLTDQEKFAPAMKLVAFSRERWPDDPLFLVYQLRLEIAQGEPKAMAATARALADTAADNNEAMFAASIGELLTITHGRSTLASNFLDKVQDDYYRDYLALLLYAFGEGDRREHALQVLQSRWSPDLQGTWPARLSQGDPSVWREMLIGYYLGKVPREDLYAPLDEGMFEASSFSNLPLSRQGMLCEFYFYDALLANVRGDRESMIRGLQATIDTDYRRYYEYKMAKLILKTKAATSG